MHVPVSRQAEGLPKGGPFAVSLPSAVPFLHIRQATTLLSPGPNPIQRTAAASGHAALPFQR